MRAIAAIVGVATKVDIALLRIDPGTNIPALPFGDSDSLRARGTVIPIGNSFGFDNTVMADIVRRCRSSPRRQARPSK